MLRMIARRILGEQVARVLFRLIVETAWPFRWHYGAALALMLVVSAMFATVALLMRDVFNDVFLAEDPAALKWLAWVVLAVFVIRGLAMFGQSVILARVGNQIVANLQKRLYDHVIRQGMVFHEANRTGDLAMRISGGSQSARMALQIVATRLGIDLTTVIGMVGVMFWNDWTMSLIALFGAPAIFGGVAYLVRRVRKQAREELEMNARVLTTIAETVQGARVIKAFNLQNYMRDRAGAAIDGARDRANRITVLQSTTAPLMEVVAGAGAAAVLLYAGWRIIGGDMEVGTFVSFLFALLAMGDPARRLAQLVVQLRQFVTGVEYIYEMLDTDMRPAERADAPPLKLERGEIVFTDVRFAYSEDSAALNGLTLTARAGEVTALVGPSGAGKSTVMSLLQRFYDARSGTIEIDGQDITGVALESLRDHMALVTQETFLFDDTIVENIRTGRADATIAEIEEAARRANAHDFIAALPRGYETRVGEGGSQLSGGQRQRVAIARAMLRDAPILLLDEATSALDAESEARVQEALERLMAGRTTLVIAHRLATIRRADTIAVLDRGRLAEQGKHDYLVRQNGLYARLAALQFGPEGATA